MTTKLIAALVIAMVLFGGWGLYKYWETFENDKQAQIQAAKAKAVDPQSLPGMPYELQASLDAAERQGASALGAWLANYSRVLQDPRKAWIELDYCVMVARENPAAAQRVFEEVKGRLSPSSPVWPRVLELQKTYH